MRPLRGGLRRSVTRRVPMADMTSSAHASDKSSGGVKEPGLTLTRVPIHEHLTGTSSGHYIEGNLAHDFNADIFISNYNIILFGD